MNFNNQKIKIHPPSPGYFSYTTHIFFDRFSEIIDVWTLLQYKRNSYFGKCM